MASMLGSLLNDCLAELDASGSFLRLKEMGWDANNDPAFDIEQQGLTGAIVCDVLQGLSVALYVVEGHISKAYAGDVWWLQQHCGVALDILDAVDLWACRHYVPADMRLTLRQDWQAMARRVDDRSRLVGVYSLAEQLRERRGGRGGACA